MSLIFCDGFDYYSAGTIYQKWTIGEGSYGIQSGGRNGNMLRTGQTIGNQHRYIGKRFFTAGERHDTFIVGAAMNRNTTNITRIIEFRSDSGSTLHLYVNVSNLGLVTIHRGDGTQLAASASGALNINSLWQYVEFKATLGDSPSGSVEVRVNGSTVCSATGVDTKNAGTATHFDQINIGSTANGMVDNQHLYVDDVYMCNGLGSSNNDFLGDVTIETKFPNANGTYSQLLGNDGNSVDNYLLVDETSPNTTDFVSSSIDGSIDTYNFQNINSTTGNVAGVFLHAYVSKSGSGGAKSIRLLSRLNGTDYAGPDKVLSTSYEYMGQLQEINPDSSVAWTRSDIDNAEFGVEVRP